MPRIRSIKPDFWKSEKIAGRLPGPEGRQARLMWIGMWNYAEDHGVIRAKPRYIAGELFPHDEDVETADVARWLALLEDARLIFRYEREGIAYYWLRGFKDHQKIDRPSPHTLPAPSAEEIESWQALKPTRRTLDEDSSSHSTNARRGLVESLDEGSGGDLERRGVEGIDATARAQPPPVPLALVVQESDQPSRFKAVQKRLGDAFAQLRRTPYVFAKGKDGKALKEILTFTEDDAEIERRWRAALAMGRWPGCSTIAHLRDRWNDLAGASATGPPRRDFKTKRVGAEESNWTDAESGVSNDFT